MEPQQQQPGLGRRRQRGAVEAPARPLGLPASPAAQSPPPVPSSSFSSLSQSCSSMMVGAGGVARWARLAVVVVALLVVLRGAEARGAAPGHGAASSSSSRGGRSRGSGPDGRSSGLPGAGGGEARGRRAFLNWLTTAGGSGDDKTATNAAEVEDAGKAEAEAMLANATAAALGTASGNSASKNWLALMRLLNLPPDSLAHLDTLTVADVESVSE